MIYHSSFETVNLWCNLKTTVGSEELILQSLTAEFIVSSANCEPLANGATSLGFCVFIHKKEIWYRSWHCARPSSAAESMAQCCEGQVSGQCLNLAENLTLKRNLFYPERSHHNGHVSFWKANKSHSIGSCRKKSQVLLFRYRFFPFYLHLTFSGIKLIGSSQLPQNQSNPAKRRRKYPQQENHTSHISD